MMKPIGRARVYLCSLSTALLLIVASAASQAAVTASLDRDRVAMGDTLRLTITATENEEISNADLRPLLADFEILQRSTSSNTSITNGRRTHTKQLLVDITPQHEGTLKVPPLRVGQLNTNMLLVSVAPAPTTSAEGQTVLFEAEVDKESVYVQGQVILTLRLQQAVNLDARSISELQLDNAFVKPLEQNSFQRTMDGRAWLVHEVRYAIFPEQSGTLEIPVQTFSARERQGRRGFFDLGSGGRQLRRTTKALTITVLPSPDAFPDATWLPARNLTLEESWSTPPEQLRAGESATRTIRIIGEGLQGAQLPPILFPQMDGLKYYPDQPEISDTEAATGLLGVRQDSAALVPTRAGNWTIPEIRIPWWDTESGELRYAVLPGRDISVAAADPATATLIPAPAIEIATATAASPGAAPRDLLLWQIIGAISTLGWLLTLGYLVWSRRKPDSDRQPAADNPSEKRAFKRLLAACASSSALHARHAIIEWASIMFPQTSVVSLSQVTTVFDDQPLQAELDRLNTSLYSPGGDSWDGSALADVVRGLRKKHKATARQEHSLQLYPEGV